MISILRASPVDIAFTGRWRTCQVISMPHLGQVIKRDCSLMGCHHSPLIKPSASSEVTQVMEVSRERVTGTCHVM
jgi:hypothetical protein